MIIKSITICNFKNFMGEHTIDVTPDSSNGRNIILVCGVNGSGKTTMLDAMRLCMFGKRFNGYTVFNSDYQRYLLSSKNKSSVKNNDQRFFIEIEIELTESFPNYCLTLKREWGLNKGGIDEKFTIFRDGVPLEIIPREYWEDYTLSIIPPHISDYFFFDGEKVKELSIGHNAEEILRSSIRDLIGLNLYETLNKDLGNLVDKIQRRNITQKKTKEGIKDKEKERLVLNKQMDNIKKNIKENSGTIEELLSELKKVEKKLKRTAGAYAKDRKNNEGVLLKLKEKTSKLDDEIKQICGEVLPFIISSDLCDDLLNQIKKERRLKELITSKDILMEVNQNLIERIDNNEKLTDISKGKINLIKEEIKKIFSEMLNELNYDHEFSILHDLTNAEADVIENFLRNTEKIQKKRLNTILKKRENNIFQMKKINDQLKRIPDESFVKKYIEDISSIRSKIEFLEKENTRLNTEKQSLEEDNRKIKESIMELEEKTVCMEEDNRKIEISRKIQNIIEKFTDTIVSSRIEELEKIITEMYQKLSNKEDMVEEIKIDKKTFVATLFDYDELVVNKENISAGEKEIYALSILWGLSKISNRKLPLITDSPLAKLDSTHVYNILTKFFPNAGEQVIILAHDREIDHESYQKLKSNINRVYTLSLDEKNKITEGYFNKT